MLALTFLVACTRTTAPAKPDARPAPKQTLLADMLAFHASWGDIPLEAQGLALPDGVALQDVLGSYGVHEDTPAAAAWTSDGRQLVTLGDDGGVHVWDARTQSLLRALDPCPDAKPRSATAMVVANDLAITGDKQGQLCVRSTADGHVVASWHAHDAPIRFLAAVPNGVVSYARQERIVMQKQMVPAYVEREEAGGELRTWDLKTTTAIAEIPIGAADAMAMSPDGAMLVVGTRRTLRAIDRDTGRPVWERDWTDTCKAETWEPCFRGIAFVPGTKQLLIEMPYRLRQVSAADGELIAPYSFPSDWTDNYPLQMLAVSPDGRTAVSGMEQWNFMFFWNTSRFRERSKPSGATSDPRDPRGAAFSRDSLSSCFGVEEPSTRR